MMLAAALLSTTALGVDGGTPLAAWYAETEARSTAAGTDCQRALAAATRAEPTDRPLARKHAAAAITVGAPMRDELEAALVVDSSLAWTLGPERSQRLRKVKADLRECVLATDLLVVRLARAEQKAQPASAAAKQAALAALEEYLMRYPQDPSAVAVKAWRAELLKAPAK